MTDFAVWTFHAHKFLRTKCLFVEIDSLRSIANNKMCGDGMHSFWNCVLCACHIFSLNAIEGLEPGHFIKASGYQHLTSKTP